MIRFVCMLCHEKLSVQEQLSGKRIKCPKCGNACVIPAESPTIKFACQSCGKGIRVLQIHAGKEAKCPKCKSPVVVPSLTADPADGSETVTIACAMCGEHIKVPKGSKERFTECPECGSNIETSLRGEPVKAASSIRQDADEEQYDDESDLTEEDEGLDRRVIFVIAGVAMVVVAGLIILVTAILPSGSEPKEESVTPAQQEIADADSRPRPAARDARPTGTFTLESPEESVGPQEPAHPETADADVPAPGLLLRLERGQKHSMRMIKEDNVSQSVTGQRQDIVSTRTTELEFEVDGVDPDGLARLKVTYLTIKERGQGAAASLQYDSTTPDVPTKHPFAPTYSAMIGQSFVAKVAPTGMITGLEGVEEMYLRMAERIVQDEAITRSGSSQKRVEHVRDQLKRNPMIADRQISDMVGNLIVPYPGRAVDVGGSWRAKQSLFSMATTGLECTYTLNQKTPSAILVDVSAKIDLQGEPVFAGEGTLGLATTTLKGSYEGTLEIDPGSGWMLRKKATMNCSGEVKISPNAQMPQGMMLPVTMETVITVEPIK